MVGGSLRQSFAGSRAKVHVSLHCFGMKSSIRRHGSGLLLLGLLAVPVLGESVLAKPIAPRSRLSRSKH
jgi:hypothetical protein